MSEEGRHNGGRHDASHKVFFKLFLGKTWAWEEEHDRSSTSLLTLFDTKSFCHTMWKIRHIAKWNNETWELGLASPWKWWIVALR
jgi:hypothetical protein